MKSRAKPSEPQLEVFNRVFAMVDRHCNNYLQLNSVKNCSAIFILLLVFNCHSARKIASSFFFLWKKLKFSANQWVLQRFYGCTHWKLYKCFWILVHLQIFLRFYEDCAFRKMDWAAEYPINLNCAI